MSLNSGLQRYREAAKKGKSTKPAAAKSAASEEAATKAPPKAAAKSPAAKSAEPASKSQGAGARVAPDDRKNPRSPALSASANAAAAKNRKSQASPVQSVAAEITEDPEVLEQQKRAQEEAELQQEIQQEVARDAAQTSKLVKEDFSPVNSPREKLIVEYAPLIKYIAQKIAARLPANIELDDLISSGVIGLMDAIDKYDSSRDNKFKTYAEFRIRGAILDELRAQDWVPRSVREKAKQLERVYARIEQSKGRQATDEEVCSELGVTQLEYHDMLNQVRSVSLLSYDDLSSFSKSDKRVLHGFSENGTKSPTPFSEVNVAAVKRMISEAIRDLPEKQRLVLSLYYYEDLNLKEIGRVLDVTESRVSQLHTQAVLRLKGKLRNHWDEFVTLFG
jgi:RNA polymerase sigma factor for flagellar operon FliA